MNRIWYHGYNCKPPFFINSIAGHVSLKVLIGVSVVCILLVIILIGVVVYYFRSCSYRKNSGAATIAATSPSTNLPPYRSTTELVVKDDETLHYEMMPWNRKTFFQRGVIFFFKFTKKNWNIALQLKNYQKEQNGNILNKIILTVIQLLNIIIHKYYIYLN